MAYDAVEYAKGRGLIVELSGEDASRADQEFLQEIFSEGVTRGGRPALFLRYGRAPDPGEGRGVIPPLAAIAPALHPLP